MKQYKDLNLKSIRDAIDIDFAHFTFLRGQCSCCYGPEDLPKRYWKDGVVKSKDYTYALFKNADNGSGIVTRNNYITDNTYILWEMPMDKLSQFCDLLQKQLDTDYLVLEPKDNRRCINILCKSEGLFKLSISDIKNYKTSFDMTEIRKLEVEDVSHIYFNNNFEIIKESKKV